MGFWKKDRFDLEADIQEMVSVSQLLKNTADSFLDGDRRYTEDEKHTAMHGIAILIECQVEKTMDTMKRVFELDEYRQSVKP